MQYAFFILVLLVSAVHLHAEQSKACSGKVEQAKSYYDQGDYPTAAKVYDYISKNCMDMDTLLAIEVNFKLISCFFHMNDRSSVEHRLSEIDLFSDASPSILLQSNYQGLKLFYQSRLARSEGDPSKALKLIDQCIELEQTRDCDEYLLLSQAYNQRGNILLMTNEIDSAKNSYQNAIGNCQNDFGNTDLYRQIDATVMGNLGVCYHYQNNFDSAMHYYELSKNGLELLGEKGGEDVARTNYNIALILESRGFLDRALEMYESSLAYYQEKYGSEHKEIARCYGAIGYVHHLRGDNAKALIPFLKDVAISESLYGKNHPFVAEALLNVALSHYQLNDLALAEDALKRIITILKGHYGDTHLELSEAYNRLALVRYGQGRLKEAVEYLENSIKIQKELRGRSSIDYIQMNVRLAQYHLDLVNNRKALLALKEARINLPIVFKNKNFEYVKVYNALARAHRQIGEIQIAQCYLDSSRQIVFGETNSEALSTFEKTFPGISHEFYSEQLKYHITHHKKNTEELDELTKQRNFKMIDRGIRLSQIIIDRYDSEQNAMIFLRNQRAFMNDVMHYTNFVYQQNKDEHDLLKLFGYVELAKSNILRGHIKFKKENESNSEIQIKRNRLRYLNSELEYALNSNAPEAEIGEIRSNLELELNELALILSPSNKIEELSLVNITEAIKKVSNLRSTTVLSYYRDRQRSLLYCFKITNGDLTFNVKTIKNLEADIESLRQDYSNYKSGQNFEQRISRLSDHLGVYDVSDNSSNTLVIPDGFLSLLPFEILIAGQNRMIEDKNIIYASSIDLFFTKKPSIKSRSRILAIAPSFDNVEYLAESKRNNLTPLSGALSEISNIKTVAPTKLVVGKEATETTFKKLAPHYRFLHIASHAVEDMDSPMRSYLKFSDKQNEKDDGFLYMNELYGLSLNADLVTLSACNTGTGAIIEGEGNMSLARNFMYAGAHNVLMSLWKVPDKETAQIMHSFYKYLAKTKEPAESLRRAKLDYLKTADVNKANPFYWAGFVLYGTDGKVKMRSKEKQKKLIILFSSLILITIVFFGWYSRTRA